MSEEARDDIRSMMEDTIKELEGKEPSVVEAAAKLEPTAKEEPAKDQPVTKEEVKEPVKEEGKETSTEEVVKEPVKEEPLLKEDKAPSAWAPAAREKWADIPQEIRQEILKREETSAQGVRRLQEETAPMRQFVEQLMPVIKEAVDNGKHAASYINQVMASERALRNPDQNQRFAALLQIADTYGIPLREVINESVGREVLTRPQQQAKQELHPEVKRELEASRQYREQQEQQAAQREINDFKSKNEFFDDVAPLMANLLEADKNMTMQQAYDQAIWAVPAVRAVLLERQGKEQKKNSLQDRQNAAAAASVKGSEEIVVKTKDEGGSLTDDLRASIAELSGRS